MTRLIADLRHAFVVYRNTPIASGIALVALAAAMGFASAFLSLWNDLSLRPPDGFESSGSLVTIGQSGGYAAADSSTPLTLDLVEGINDSVSTLEFAVGIASFPQMIQLDETQVTIQAEAVTRHFGDLLPRLQLGRTFDAEHHLAQSEPVAMLSYRFWQDRFGGSPDILGKTVRISEVARTVGSRTLEPRSQDYRIVGVMSPRMTGTFADTIEVWLPYEQVVPFLYGESDSGTQRELGITGLVTTTGAASVPTRMRGLARLAAGAGPDAAGNEINARFVIEGQALAQGFDLSGAAMRFDVIDGVVRNSSVHRESRRQVGLFLIGTLLLVLVAACNISLFLLARASRRQRELGIRMSVGASFRRLALQLVSEAGLLIVLSTALGVLFGAWLSTLLRELPFLETAEWRDVSLIDWRVLGMLAGLMLLLTALVSFAPILGIRRLGIGASSALVTARAGPGQRVAGSFQVALTGVVGAVAVAFVWHLVFYARADRGFDASDVLVVELERRPAAGGADPAGGSSGVVVERERRREVIAGLPGIEEASFATYAPGGAGAASFTIIQRESGEYVEYTTIYTDAHYIEVLDIPLAHGTNLDPNDALQLVGNETYAISRFGRADAAGEVTPTNYTVQGVMKDAAFGHPAAAIAPIGLSSFPQGFYSLLLVETAMSPVDLRGMLEQRIEAGELELAFGDIRRLSDIVRRDLRPDRARAGVTVSAACLVMILAAFGFYGTQRYVDTAGQREYAIRAALGAGPRSLGRLVLVRSFALALPGLVFGSLLAFIAVAWLRDGFVTGAVSIISVTLIVVLLLVLLTFCASIAPAGQARRTAPALLLRES